MTTRWRSGLAGVAPRIWMPNFHVEMLLGGGKTTGNLFAFKVPLWLTKIELRNFLTSVYGLNVLKINTMVVGSRWRRGNKGFKRNQRKAYKKAIVRVSPEDVPPAILVDYDKRRTNFGSGSYVIRPPDIYEKED